MICQVGDLIDGFGFVVGLGGDDDFCGFFADFLQDLIYTFFKEVVVYDPSFFSVLRPSISSIRPSMVKPAFSGLRYTRSLKHESVPRWQAGPSLVTVTTSASLSQSAIML